MRLSVANAFRIFIVGFLFFCVLVGRSFAQVVITEVMWMGSDLSTADEWLEISNIESSNIETDLSGWWITTLKSDGSEEVMIRFATGTTISSGQILIISNYDESKSRLAIEPDIVSPDVSLPNSKLMLRIYDASGSLIDQADDGVGEPFEGSNESGKPKASMVRINLSGSGSDPLNWITSTGSVNFDSGAVIYGTPGIMRPGIGNREVVSSSSLSSQSSHNSSASSASLSSSSSFLSSSSSVQNQIRLTEVLANPMGRDDHEWVEIGNLGNESVDIYGWYLSDGGRKYVFESGTVLLAGEHRLYDKSVTSIALTNAGGAVSLWNGDIAMDAIAYEETAEEVSYGRDPDDGTTWIPLCLPTPNTPNTRNAPNVQINIQSGETSGTEKVSLNLEAIARTGSLDSVTCDWDYGDGTYMHDRCNPPSHTFREVGNYSILLTAHTFCNQTIERTLTVTVHPKASSSSSNASSKSSSLSSEALAKEEASFRCTISASTGVVISEFLPNPAGDDAEGEWIELFNTSNHDIDFCGWTIDDAEGGSKPYALDDWSINARSYLVLPRSETKIALNNSDESVRLLMGEVLVDEVDYEKSIENYSLARDEEDEFNWTSVLTPGSENVFSVESTLSSSPILSTDPSPNPNPSPISKLPFISEIYPSPLADEDEWIELYNPHDTDIPLGGWQLDDIWDGGSRAWNIPEGVVLPRNAYILFFRDQTGLALNNGGDEVSIILPDGEVSDCVSYEKMKKGKAWINLDTSEAAQLKTKNQSTKNFCITDVPTPGFANVCKEFANSSSARSSSRQSTEVIYREPKVKYENVLMSSETGATGALMSPALAQIMDQQYQEEEPDEPVSNFSPIEALIMASLSLASAYVVLIR